MKHEIIPIMAAVLCGLCFFALPAHAKYGGGSGTAEDPYLIYTANQMNAIGANPVDWDKHFKLMADIDLSGFTGTSFNIIGYWVPPDKKPFTGVFDGNDHEISSFTYSSNDANYLGVGLFGFVFGAKIINLKLTNPSVCVSASSRRVGALVGWLAGEATIENCCVDGGNVTGGEYFVGGLVGYNSMGNISGCYSSCEVSGNESVGGLIGRNFVYSTVSNCCATGNIIGENSVGVLAGTNRGKILDSYAIGTAVGNNTVGGLVGENEGIVITCYSAETVSGNTNVGGLVGKNSYGKVLNSFWDIQTSGLTQSDGGTGKTTAEMWDPDTFFGWGCGFIWTIDKGKDYPRLAWENMPGEIITNPSYCEGSGEPNDPYLIYTAHQINKIGLIPCHWDKHFKLMADIDLSGYTGPEPPPPPPPLPPLYASNPNPADGAITVNKTAFLNWTAGHNAVSHDVYFGTSSIPPFVCNQTSTIFDPGTMAFDTKYYWRIDEVNDSVTTTGDIWSFTTIMSPPPPPPPGPLPPPPPMEDIDLSGYSGTAFNIIGNKDNPFTGVFDGNGHIISNFSYTSTERNYIGLFGCVREENAEIKDLGLINPNVNAGTGGRAGSLVGWLSAGTITNCYIEGGNVSGHDYVGGLAGLSYGIIKDCSSSATIKGYGEIGGLIGYFGGLLSRCRSTGNVSGHYNLGGLVGANDGGTVERCCAYGDIIATGAVVGGLVGYQCYGYTYESYATGNVIGDMCVGGLIGRYYIPVPMGASEATSSYAVIYNCYSAGAVIGNKDVGGLMGHNIYSSWAVAACFWDTETSGQTSSDGGIGLPTAEMQMASTFIDAGWDFNTPVWTIDEGVDYPRLWWELAPMLHAEPDVTLGTTNTISWDPVPGGVDYYAECAEDSNFTNILHSTGWITEISYEFTGLELGQRYWYSVKARNSAGVETDRSNVESSPQGTLLDAVAVMLDPDTLKSKNMKNALLNKINTVQQMLDKGRYEEALNKLQNDILQKTDGCAETGRPDKNDWIITCQEQSVVAPLIIETIEHVTGLMNQ